MFPKGDAMKKILVPVDFSDFSKYALEVASKLAKQHGSGIVLLHMIGMSDSVLANSELAEEAEAKYFLKLAKDKIKELTEQEFLKGIAVNAIIQNYKDFEEVNKVAQEQDCDLIVMGSHGASGIRELFCGLQYRKSGTLFRPTCYGHQVKTGRFRFATHCDGL